MIEVQSGSYLEENDITRLRIATIVLILSQGDQEAERIVVVGLYEKNYGPDFSKTTACR
ncbi:MAG: hypothetical protein ACYDEV_09585 [Acidiferrobacter sp.]